MNSPVSCSCCSSSYPIQSKISVHPALLIGCYNCNKACYSTTVTKLVTTVTKIVTTVTKIVTTVTKIVTLFVATRRCWKWKGWCWWWWRDEATEVQTNFASSQNYTMIITTKSKIINKNSSIPPLLVILITTKPYRIWYSPLHVGVVATNRRECKRNHIKM